MARERPATFDVLFLAITREASVYGVSVPLPAFVIVALTASAAFDFSFRYSLAWRAGLVSAYVILALASMAALSSWENRWFGILSAFCRTRGIALLSPWTRRFGGTTYRPWPTAAGRDAAELRDYAG